MSEINLNNLDVDKLFEQHNVAEIDQILKQLQTNVETKKEEIRTMVGERYRDLLQAADTIIQMQDTSSSFVGQMKLISKECEKLNETQLFGFKTDSHVDENTELYFVTNIRLRLLTLLADLVWEKMEQNEYFVAAQIYILCEHIVSSLKLETNNPFSTFYSVQNKVYGLVELASISLRENVTKCLESDDLSAELASDCILCLYMLDKPNIENLLTSFLERRVVAYKRNLSQNDVEKRVKDRILSGFKVLVSTLDLVNQCFFSSDTEECLILKKVNGYRESHHQPTVCFVDYDKQEWLEFLPPSIKNFRPHLEDLVIESSVIKTCCSTWLKTISSISSSELRSLFDLITSLRVIKEIKNEAYNLEANQQHRLMQSTPTVNFYKETYIPLINERVKSIITQSWSKCIEETCSKVDEAATKPLELNENENLWRENEDDLPSSLNIAVNQDKKDNRLLMKIKGYSPEIVAICRFFDESVCEIFAEARLLIDDKTQNDDSDKFLIDFLKNITENQISDLITKLKNFVAEKKAITIIFVAKFLVALTELCPNLKTCLNFNNLSATSGLTKEWSSFIADKKYSGKFAMVSNLIEEESLSMWKKFCDLFLNDFFDRLHLNEKMSYRTVLDDFVNWETIKIEEKDEEDNAIASSIRIPSQPRISIQKFLFDLIRILNDLVPQTLPVNVLRYLTTKLVTYFLDYYKKLTECKFTTTNQNMALQLYFDLKFLQTIFTAREEKKLIDEFQKLTNTLKTYIDPFDFELFFSYLTNNVKKCVYRMQHQLGVLLPYPESLIALTSDLRGSTSLIEKDPNVIILSSSAATATWFPLLPVVTDNKPDVVPTETVKIPAVISSEPVDDTKQASQNYATNVKSGAAAFFGAMGAQDWFR